MTLSHAHIDSLVPKGDKHIDVLNRGAEKMAEGTDLAVLDDVGVHGVVHVTARVLPGVPLAAPHTGHAGHAPAGQTDW